MFSALSMRIFGEDITTAAREAAAKKKEKVEGEKAKEGGEAAAMPVDTPAVLEDGNAEASEQPGAVGIPE